MTAMAARAAAAAISYRYTPPYLAGNSVLRLAREIVENVGPLVVRGERSAGGCGVCRCERVKIDGASCCEKAQSVTWCPQWFNRHSAHTNKDSPAIPPG